MNSNRLNHSFSVEFADHYGIECALVIHHLQYWIEHNQALGRNFIEGRTWMYQTQKEIAAHFTYMSEDSVYRILKKLEDHEVIIKGNFNKSKFDKTTWYAFKNEEIFTKPRNRKIGSKESQNQNHDPTEPIPNNITYNITETTTGGASPPPKPPDAVVFFECLMGIEIPESDKEWICKNYDEPTVKHALAVVTHPSFVVKETFQQAIKWACKSKPSIPKKEEDIEKENREIAQKIEKYTVSTSNSFYAAVNSGAEIGFPVQGIVEVIKYTEKQFKSLLKKALNQYKVNISKENIEEVRRLLA